MRTLALLTVMGIATLSGAADQPAAEEKLGPRLIDFSPLQEVGGKVEYKVRILIENSNNPTNRVKEGYNVGKNCSVRVVLLTIKTSLEGICSLEEVGETKLVIKDFKGFPITKVEVRVEGIDKKLTPSVKLLAKKAAPKKEK